MIKGSMLARGAKRRKKVCDEQVKQRALLGQ
jgi:hypothetical protein